MFVDVKKTHILLFFLRKKNTEPKNIYKKSTILCLNFDWDTFDFIKFLPFTLNSMTNVCKHDNKIETQTL
jgi:hypothetical protein